MAAIDIEPISPIDTEPNTISLKIQPTFQDATSEDLWSDSVSCALSFHNESMDISADDSKKSKPQPEAVVFILVLVLSHLLDSKSFDNGIKLSESLVKYLQAFQRRTLDPIAAKVYSFYSRFYEFKGQLNLARPTLLKALQTSMLNKSSESLAILINSLLRDYIHYKLYGQAEKLYSRSTFPESASNGQIARYLYYVGKTEAIELDYSNSHIHLQDASRKVAINSSTAGFHQAVYKTLAIVSLLIGEIPERSIFKNKFLRRALHPYFELVLAVRTGELAQFQHVISKHESKFRKDGLYILILRLRHNVIKTGIRSICTSYKRLSLREICLKLHLDSEEDAEYIFSKAINDGVVDATIDHEKGFIQTKEASDAYSTGKAQEIFNMRINYCLKLYNDTVRAMRYPDSINSKDFDFANEAREREREIAHELAETDYDDDNDDDSDSEIHDF
ncbi:putative 26S proteasome regulatory subunit rpn3 [Smittium culicis]|uniref:Putative 26S proteasome regulatory subunit rpn3 n=2 Tax=Smittium culicis TaxID=133412 RepID=A0A1R1YP38_9FUNG|nr:putative 26S proteasome regulatory subunit rpn3 [Smittium culicis]